MYIKCFTLNRKNIRASWQAALKCTPPVRLPVTSVLNTNTGSLLTELPGLSSTRRSRIHVHACATCTQESWLNLHVADALISIHGFDVYRMDTKLSAKNRRRCGRTNQFLLVKRVWTNLFICIFWYWLLRHSVSSYAFSAQGHNCNEHVRSPVLRKLIFHLFWFFSDFPTHRRRWF